MKKVLLCGILALAAGSMAFAQQWPDWFSVSGHVRTGVRADFLGGVYGQEKADGQLNTNWYIPTSRDRAGWMLWHDDAGNRAQVDMKFELEDIGFMLKTRYNFDDGDGTLKIYGAWGWLDLMNDMFRINVGRIDQTVWASPTPKDEHFDNGMGVRIEAKPIEGLNVGWFIGHGVVQNRATDIGEEGFNNRFRDAFASSSFGAKYKSDMFTLGAGLQLLTDGMRTSKMEYGFGGNGDIYVPTQTYGNNLMGPDDFAATAYLGVEVKPIEALTLQVGGYVGNMGKDIWKGNGWLWLNEYVSYSLGTLTPYLEMHQKFDLSEASVGGNPVWNVDKKNPTKKQQTPVYLEFTPGVEFALSDNLTPYVEIPLAFWSKWYQIGVKPGVTYKFASNLEIAAYYQFLLSDNTYKNLDDYDPAIRNTVQVSLNWTF